MNCLFFNILFEIWHQLPMFLIKKKEFVFKNCCQNSEHYAKAMKASWKAAEKAHYL